MTEKDIQVYVGATLSNRGARLQNEETKKTLENAGLQAYLPQDDKSINDKANANPLGLAERIVEKDLNAIKESDMYLFDITETTGTTAEVGYIQGRKDMAMEIFNLIYALDISEVDDIYDDVAIATIKEVEKPFVATCSDFRRENKNSQAGDRREWAINQMLYGLVLSLTDGKGFTEFDDLEDTLKEVKEQINNQ